MTIVVTGGSGFIGTALTKALLDKGHTVIVVDIKAPVFTHEHLFYIQCDLSSQALPYNVLERTDAVVHLAGASITSKKWNEAFKEEIRTSRIESTKRVVESIKETSSKPTVFVCASAIGYYGDTKEEIVDEQSAQGEGFLAETVELWETEAKKAEEYGLRVVCVRTAPVLGTGGILKEITKPAKFGFILKLKKEDYWMSWIHHGDIVAAYLFALETKTLQGIVNASSPEPVLHSEFMRTLGMVLHRRVIGTLPKKIAKFILGECFDEITKNQQVLPRKLIDKGLEFSHPHLKEALTDIFKHEKSR